MGGIRTSPGNTRAGKSPIGSNNWSTKGLPKKLSVSVKGQAFSIKPWSNWIRRLNSSHDYFGKHSCVHRHAGELNMGEFTPREFVAFLRLSKLMKLDTYRDVDP